MHAHNEDMLSVLCMLILGSTCNPRIPSSHSYALALQDLVSWMKTHNALLSTPETCLQEALYEVCAEAEEQEAAPQTVSGLVTPAASFVVVHVLLRLPKGRNPAVAALPGQVPQLWLTMQKDSWSTDLAPSIKLTWTWPCLSMLMLVCIVINVAEHPGTEVNCDVCTEINTMSQRHDN